MSELGNIAPPDPKYLLIPQGIYALERFEASHSLDPSDSELVEEFKGILNKWKLSKGGLIFKNNSVTNWHKKRLSALKRAEFAIEDPHARSPYNTLLIAVNNPPYVKEPDEINLNKTLNSGIAVKGGSWDQSIKGSLSHKRGETSVHRIKPAIEITLAEGEEYSVRGPIAKIRWVWQQGASIEQDEVVTRFQIRRRFYSVPNALPGKHPEEMSADDFARTRRGVIFSAEYAA